MLFLGNESEEYKQYSHQKSPCVIKSGQRKLFFNTMYFLDNTKKNSMVIYAGAAPGRNLIPLIKYCKDITFVLFDVNPFHTELVKNSINISSKKIKNCSFKSHSNVYICNELFTDDICKVICEKNENIYLISDIRTGSRETHDTINIPQDMAMQKNWYNLLKPQAAMFKFRLPWTSGETLYLDGDIMLQPRIGAKSTETRLLVGRNAKEVIYDHDSYNNRMYYYNKNIRNQQFSIDSKYIVNGMCRCNDCWIEIKILEICNVDFENYLYKMNNDIRWLGDLELIVKESYEKKCVNFITPGYNQKVYILSDGKEVACDIGTKLNGEICHKFIKNKYYLNCTLDDYYKLVGIHVNKKIPNSNQKVYVLSDGSQILVNNNIFILGEKQSFKVKYKFLLNVTIEEFRLLIG